MHHRAQRVLSKEVHLWIKHESIFFVFSFFFPLNDFQLLFIYPRGETDLIDKPLIKGIPRYKEAKCIPRRTYSDLCSMFLKSHCCWWTLALGELRLLGYPIMTIPIWDKFGHRVVVYFI